MNHDPKRITLTEDDRLLIGFWAADCARAGAAAIRCQGYCFDSKGNIQQWYHEEDCFRPFDGTFFDLLEQEFKALDERRKQKKAEKGQA